MLTPSTTLPRRVSAPALQYHGAKWTLAPFIIQHFPQHHVYVEPFAGSACVLLNKQPSPIEVYNDAYGDVVNFFRVLRNQPKKLVEAIQLTPNARREFERAYEMLRTPFVEEPSPRQALERARAFYVSVNQSVSGMRRWKTSWKSSKSSRSSVLRWVRVEHLYEIAERFHKVQIECGDVFDVLKRYDTPNTLFYLDPPYLKSTRQRRDNHYVVEASDDEFHRRLAAALHDIKGMALISGYPSTLYDELYEDWTVEKTKVRDRTNRWRDESLWISPRTRARHVQQTLF